MSRQIGPSLPPGFMSKDDSDSDPDDPIGPTPTNQEADKRDSIGPSLPPGFAPNRSDDSIGGDSSANQKTVVGPALPPDYGRSLPGPALPPGIRQSESDDDDVIGPMLSEIEGSGLSVQDEFERRVSKMKEKLEGKNKPKKLERETWMTELPSIDLTAQLGLGARQFRTNKAPAIDDLGRDTWTTVGGENAPGSSKNNKRSAETEFYPEELAKDRKIAVDVQKFNETARAESLMQMHSKKLKKEESKKDKDEILERVPFDRERDFNTKKFDDVQRKAILKKAAKLDSRFSHGGKQYL